MAGNDDGNIFSDLIPSGNQNPPSSQNIFADLIPNGPTQAAIAKGAQAGAAAALGGVVQPPVISKLTPQDKFLGNAGDFYTGSQLEFPTFQSPRSPTGYLKRVGPGQYVPTPKPRIVVPDAIASMGAGSDASYATNEDPNAYDVVGETGKGLGQLGEVVNQKVGQVQDWAVTHPFGIYSPTLDKLNKGVGGQVAGGARDAILGAANPLSMAGFIANVTQDPAGALDGLVTMVAKAEGIAPSDSLRDRVSSIVGSGMLTYGLAHGLGQTKGALADTLGKVKAAVPESELSPSATAVEQKKLYPEMSDADLWQQLGQHQAILNENPNASASKAVVDSTSAELTRRAQPPTASVFTDLIPKKTEAAPVTANPFADLVPKPESAVPDIAPRPNPVAPEATPTTEVSVSPTDAAPLPPSWQRTRSDFIGNAHPEVAPLMGNVHEASVRTALAEGHDVPLDVLQDYPQLAASRGIQTGTDVLRNLAPDDPRLSLDDPFGEHHDPDLVRAAYKAQFGELPPVDEHGMPTDLARSSLRQALEANQLANTPRDLTVESQTLPQLQSLAKSGQTEPFWRVFTMKNGEKAVDARSPTQFVSLEGLPLNIQRAIVEEAGRRSGDRSYLSDQQYRSWVDARKPTIRGALDLSEVAARNASDEGYTTPKAGTSETGLDRAIVPRSIVAEYAKGLKDAIAHNDELTKVHGKYPSDAEIEAAKNRALAPAETPPSETVGVYNARQAKDVAAGEYAEPEKGERPTAEAIHAKGKDVTSLEDAESLGQRVRARAESADSTDTNLSRAKEGARLFQDAINKARDAELQAINSGSPDVQALRDARVSLEARRQQFLNDIQKGKTEWHNAGRALQQESTLDTGSYADMVREATLAKGAPLTVAEDAKVKAATDEIAELNKRVSDLENKTRAQLESDRGEFAARKRAPLSADEKVATKARIKDNASRLARLLTVPEHVGAGPADFFQKFPEARALVRDIAHDVVRLGANSLDEMVAGVKKILTEHGVKEMPEDRDIRDAFTGYGAEPEARTPNEAAARVSELKTLGKLQGQIEDATAGESAKKITNRKPVSDVIADARKTLAEIRKGQATRNAVPKDPAVLLERRLSRMLDTLENGPKAKAEAEPATPRMVELQKRISDTAKAIREKFGESEESKRVRALEKQLADAREKLTAGPKTPKAGVQGPPTARVAELERQLAEANKALAAKYKGDAVANRLAKMADTYDKLDHQFRTNTRAAAVDKGFEPSVLEDAKQQLADMRKKINVQDQINELNRKIRERDFSTPSKRTQVSFKELEDLKKLRQQRIRELFQAAEDARVKPLGEKIHKGLLGWQRFGLVSSPATAVRVALSNLGSAIGSGASEVFNRPAEYLTKLTGGTSAGAETRGSLRGQIEAAKVLGDVGTNVREGAQKVKTGADSLDLLAEEAGLIPGHRASGTLEKIGTGSHVIAAEPAKRAEFARQFQKSTEQAKAEGLDPNDPKTHAAIFAESYAAAQRGTLLNENLATKQLTSIKGSLRRTGSWGQAIAAALDFAVPLTHVPFNAAGRVVEYTPGISQAYALGRTGIERAFSGERLSPESAQAIARAYKRGGVGLAVTATAAMLPQFNVDKKGDLTWNGSRVEGYMSHLPFLGAIRVGVLLRNAAGPWWKAIPGATLDATAKAMKHAPLMSESTEASRAMLSGEGLATAAGKKVSQLAVPFWLQEAGRYMDPASEHQSVLDAAINSTPESRSAHGFWGSIIGAMPKLRETLPTKAQEKEVKKIQGQAKANGLHIKK